MDAVQQGRVADARRPAFAGTCAGTRSRMRSGAGFTVIELMFVVAVAAILAALGHGQFSSYVERSKIAVAKGDIATLEVEILRYQTNHQGSLPVSLAEIGRDELLDPWQRSYHYVDLTGKSKGKARKDRRLNPINSDYDLFSAGKDGEFKPQVSQKDSLDDVIRARNGAYIGVARDF